MMLRKVAALFFVLFLLPGFALGEEIVLLDAIHDPASAENFAFAEDAALLEIVFPKILNCDAALLRCGGETMLIDCASAYQAGKVTGLMELLGMTELDYAVNTHPHYDHIEGLAAIADAAAVKSFWICHDEDETEQMVKALSVAAAKGIPVMHYEDGDRFALGGTTIDVWLKCDDSCPLNERSAVMRVQFGERTALFTADMRVLTEIALLEKVDAALLDIDLLKYPHHGKEKLKAEFLAATSPLFGVITNNNGKSIYEAKRTLSYNKIPYAVTVSGYTYCATDGQTWLVKYMTEDELAAVRRRWEDQTAQR